MIPDELLKRLESFESSIQNLYKSQEKKRRSQNLLPSQKRILSELRRREDLLVVHCDKNLGPAVIKKEAYLKLAITNHFWDKVTYKRLSLYEAETAKNTLKGKLLSWLGKYRNDLTLDERKFFNAGLQQHNLLPVFYQTMKVHKGVDLTRPVVSCSGSLLYSLGVWADHYLQKVAIKQDTYLKSSRVLKEELTGFLFPPSAKLFIADAHAMYTNIKCDPALREIDQFLHQRSARFPNVPASALMEALSLIMKNNFFQFGDTFWRQKVGTCMGTPVGPSYANLFFAIHENRINKKIPPTHLRQTIHRRYFWYLGPIG